MDYKLYNRDGSGGFVATHQRAKTKSGGPPCTGTRLGETFQRSLKTALVSENTPTERLPAASMERTPSWLEDEVHHPNQDHEK